MRVVLFWSTLAILGIPALACAGVATFHCDAAPVDRCYFMIQTSTGSVKNLAPVAGGEAAIFDGASKGDTYCRAVNHEPDNASCERQPVPMDADFRNRVMPQQ